MFTFFRLPKCLVNNVYFAELSADAKLLYAFFLDRVSLSIKNGWIDDKGRVFIYYSVKRVCKWFREELSEERKQQVMSAIEEIKLDRLKEQK